MDSIREYPQQTFIRSADSWATCEHESEDPLPLFN